MNYESETPGGGYRFITELAGKWIEEATRAYYTCDPKSLERLKLIIDVEDNQRVALFMGVPAEDIVKASLRGIPESLRQDYLDTIYDSGILFGGDTAKIAQEFNLVSPTLGI